MFSPKVQSEESEQSGLHRLDRPYSFSVGFGAPAPSWLSFAAAWQFRPRLKARAGFGFFWVDELTVRPVELSLRMQLFRTQFTPFVGAGFNWLRLSGEGSIQGLETSTLLLSLSPGIEWQFKETLQLALGLNLHYPLVLNFPFFEVGYTF
jgi:hypothetical protein